VDISGAKAGSSKPVEAATGDTMWSMWQSIPSAQRPSWEQFQKDFRNWNPKAAADGQLKAGETYQAPLYGPAPVNPDQQEGRGDPQSSQTTSSAQDKERVAQREPANAADGSSRASAMQIAAGEMFSVIGGGALEILDPDALVIAGRWQIRVDDIPGAKRIPGFSQAAGKAAVNVLLASLTPMEPKGMNPNLQPKDTTLFLSLGLAQNPKNPKKDPPAPFVITFKASDLTLEAGRAKNGAPTFGLEENQAKGRKGFLGKGDIILFSNARAGGSIQDPGPVVSANAGILVKAGRVQEISETITGLLRKTTRAAQGVQLGAGVVGAPETGGASLLGSAAGIAASELLRATLINSFKNVTWYGGFAWRAEARMPIAADGTVSVLAKKGMLQGRWVKFNVKDVANGIVDKMMPDFDNPNRGWLIDAGARPEIAEAISRKYDVHFYATPPIPPSGAVVWTSPEPRSIRPLVEQIAEYRGVEMSELAAWLDRQDKKWIEAFAANHMTALRADRQGRFPVEADQDARRSISIADLVRVAKEAGRPMPGGTHALKAPPLPRAR
jgi:hypothetical protein